MRKTPGLCCKPASPAIPGSVTSIGERAFYECSSLKNITFTDTIEQWWTKVKKGSDWHYGVPTATEVQCSDDSDSLY